ncbi:unnamed protein product [Rhodiola kirilowii]
MSEKKLTAPARGELELDTAVPEEEETVTTTSSVVVESPKRRKVEAGETEPPDPPSAITELSRSSLFNPSQYSPSRKEKKDSAAISRLSFLAPPTACSEEECFKSADLEAGYYKCDNSSENNTVVSSPESEVCVDLPEMESQSIASTRSVVYEAPTAEEIEEFFSAAEKIEAQRFKEKYNYDIVNDVPVEGRFQWSRVKQ